MLHLDESPSVGQVSVEAMTFLCSLQLILTLPRRRLQVLPACTANMSVVCKTALHTNSLGIM